MKTIRIISFGYSFGPPPNANMVFDMRFIRNPHYVETLRPFPGTNPAVASYILEQEVSNFFRASLQGLLAIMIPGYIEHGHDHEELVLAFGCTGGRHRSVCFAVECERIARELQGALNVPDLEIALEHRDMNRHD